MSMEKRSVLPSGVITSAEVLTLKRLDEYACLMGVHFTQSLKI